MHLVVIIFFIIVVILYLCGFFDGYRSSPAILQDALQVDKNIMIIEHLTQFKDRSKDYRTSPKGFTSYNKTVSAYIQDQKAIISYAFPFIDRKISVYNCTLSPMDVSNYVNQYGVQQSYVSKVDANTVSLNQSIPEKKVQVELNRGGWFFKDWSNWGLDYAKIVDQNAGFSYPIAKHIYNELVTTKADSFINRVQAALNFVQFIPYGRPNFDTAEWYYHEVAIPAESLVLGYSDCDSKSILLATILLHLVPKENVVLIECEVRAADEKINGAHMMVAVSGLDINGETVNYKNTEYTLLETTAPVVMGKSDWAELQVKNIISL